jgi:hypothetical protein
MIIKRRVTRGFVQIANDVVRDQRLALDEHGLLHYLLSLPDDWEVNLKQIETYWNIGRDKRRRLFRALRKNGWAKLERIEAEDGTFLGQRWIIGDEPGPEITDETLAAQDETEDADGAPTNTTAAPESKGPDALVSARRETPSQAVGSPDGRETRPPENTVLPRRKTAEEEIDSTNTSEAGSNADSGSEDPGDNGAPPPRFGEVLRLWPQDNVTSSFACEKAFAKLTDKQRIDAFNAIRPYLADCRTKGQTRLCDLRTYLDERRFERFVGKASTRQLSVTKRGTPQAVRWRDHFARTAPNKLAMFDQMMRMRGEYTTESEWPPPTDPMTKTA